MVDIKTLDYQRPAYMLKNMGALVQTDDDEIVAHMFDPHTMDTYIRKVLTQDDTYTYYVDFRVGFVGFYYFFTGARTLRQWFLECKDYHIVRHPISDMSDGAIEISQVVKDKDSRLEFCELYGPDDKSFYNEDIYTEYAKQLAQSVVK